MSRFLKFAGLGAFSFALSVGGTAFLVEVIGVDVEVAYATVLACLIAINFLACRYLIFPGQARGFAGQAAQFLVSALGFRGLEYVAFLVLHTLLGAPYVLAIVTVQTISFVTKFLFFDTLVFSASQRPR